MFVRDRGEVLGVSSVGGDIMVRFSGKKKDTPRTGTRLGWGEGRASEKEGIRVVVAGYRRCTYPRGRDEKDKRRDRRKGRRRNRC